RISSAAADQRVDAVEAECAEAIKQDIRTKRAVVNNDRHPAIGRKVKRVGAASARDPAGHVPIVRSLAVGADLELEVVVRRAALQIADLIESNAGHSASVQTRERPGRPDIRSNDSVDGPEFAVEINGQPALPGAKVEAVAARSAENRQRAYAA